MAIGQKWVSDLRRGWEVVRERGLSISLRQFLSILALLGIAHKGKLGTNTTPPPLPHPLPHHLPSGFWAKM